MKKQTNIIRSSIVNWLSENPQLWTNPLSLKNIVRGISGPLRVLPDFIIIGGAKCGTTSLYELLIQHPDIYPALWKEVHFFDKNYGRGMNWYKANFPSKLQKFFRRASGKKFLTGEATPYYLFHPLSPEYISKNLPDVKLIVLLRNPIDRAYSHYNMEKRMNQESETFEEAIRLEEERLNDEEEKILKTPSYNSFNHQVFSYLARGKYILQLKKWNKFFPKEKLLILQTEFFESNTNDVLKEIHKFLGIDHHELQSTKKYNVGKYSTMKEETRQFLRDYFEPFNKDLYDFLGNNFNWK